MIQRMLLLVVGYIRMSTDKQEDSPARQKMLIKQMAEREGWRIVGWYEDHGLSGTESLNRPEFQKLMTDAKTGKFQGIVMSEQSRFSREDVFDVMLHWKLLRDEGVRLFTVQQGEIQLDNLGGLITAIVGQHGAREESVKFADRVVSGKKMNAMQGKRVGGRLFGFDREIRDEAGNFVRRVAADENFAKPKDWSSIYVPSSNHVVTDLIQESFQAIRNGESKFSIVRRFREAGITTPAGLEFNLHNVDNLLLNPAYKGTLRVGHQSRAKFRKLNEDGVIYFDNAHEPIVDPQLYDEVQEILEARKKPREPRKPGVYLLGGLVKCGTCGYHAVGVSFHRNRRLPRSEENLRRQYRCNLFDCRRKARVDQRRLENGVLDVLSKKLLQDAKSEIRKKLESYKSQKTDSSVAEQGQIRELRRKIERGTENLALADADDFHSISRLLATWKKQEAELLGRIERKQRAVRPTVEAMEAVEDLGLTLTRLDLADRTKLQVALRATIEKIVVTNQWVETGKIRHHTTEATIQFADVLNLDPIHIGDELIGQPKIWMDVVNFVRDLGRPAHIADVLSEFDWTEQSLASYHLRRGVLAGLLTRLPKLGGWIAT